MAGFVLLLVLGHFWLSTENSGLTVFLLMEEFLRYEAQLSPGRKI
jgi:hypothetical protein